MAAGVSELCTASISVAAVSITGTCGAAVPVGTTLIVCALADSTTGQSDGQITDTKSNTYHGIDLPSWAGAHRALMWWGQPTTPLTTSDTITFNNASGDLKALQVLAVTGLISSPLDVFNDNSGQTTSTPSTGSSGTLAQTDELGVALYGYTGAPSFTPTATWSQPTTHQVSSGGTVYTISIQYLETAATTALNPTATLGSSVTCCGMIATFKVAAVVVPSTSPWFALESDSERGIMQERQNLFINTG